MCPWSFVWWSGDHLYIYDPRSVLMSHKAAPLNLTKEHKNTDAKWNAGRKYQIIINCRHSTSDPIGCPYHRRGRCWGLLCPSYFYHVESIVIQTNWKRLFLLMISRAIRQLQHNKFPFPWLIRAPASWFICASPIRMAELCNKTKSSRQREEKKRNDHGKVMADSFSIPWFISSSWNNTNIENKMRCVSFNRSIRS